MKELFVCLLSLLSLLACAAAKEPPKEALKQYPSFMHHDAGIFHTLWEHAPDMVIDPDLPRTIRFTPQQAIAIADNFMRDALGPEFPLHVSSVCLGNSYFRTTKTRGWTWGVTYLHVKQGPTDEETFIIGTALTVHLTEDGRVLMR